MTLLIICINTHVTLGYFSLYVIIKILYTYIELNPARWSEYSTCVILQKSLRPLDLSNQHLFPCHQATLLSPDMQSYAFNAVVSAFFGPTIQSLARFHHYFHVLLPVSPAHIRPLKDHLKDLLNLLIGNFMDFKFPLTCGGFWKYARILSAYTNLGNPPTLFYCMWVWARQYYDLFIHDDIMM